MTASRLEYDDHPEALLDLAAVGQLGEPDWTTLRQHLAVCAPCAQQFSFAARAAREIPARVANDALEGTAVRRAEARLFADRPSGSRRPRRTRRWLTLAFNVLLLSGTAAAATWWSVRAINRARPSAEGQPRLDPAPPDRTAPQAAVATTAAAPPSPAAATSPAIAAAGTGSALDRADGAAAVNPPPQRAALNARGEDDSAGALFERARSLRLRGNIAAAIATYRRLQSHHGRSREGQLSYLIVARLYMETGRPEQAAAQFATYLADGGSAWQEALVGRAAAFARLGRTSDEAADWRRLLSRDPTSVYGARARSRLAELDRAGGVPSPGPGGP